MRHIHVEIARKEASLELPDHSGDLPPPSTQTGGVAPGVRPGVIRPYGQEEIKMQKVYQLSIFSQLGGFSEMSAGQRPVRPGWKRSLEERPPGGKRPHLAPGELRDRHPLPSLGQEAKAPVEVMGEGEVLCGFGKLISNSGPCAVGPGGDMTVQDPSCQVASTPLPLPLAPTLTQNPNQYNHSQPIASPEAPLSNRFQPQHSAMAVDATTSAILSRVEPLSACGTSGCPPVSQAQKDINNGELLELQDSDTIQSTDPTLHDPEVFEDSDRPAQKRGGPSMELSPTDCKHRQDVSNNGLASSEKTPCTFLDVPPGSSSPPSSSHCPCPAKRRLLSPSDTGESCSEDEGPSTSKRSRLALLAPGIGLGACRSTDAKAAPFWNHLLPSAREHPKAGVTGSFLKGGGGRVEVKDGGFSGRTPVVEPVHPSTDPSPPFKAAPHSATDCTRVGRRLKSGIRLKSSRREACRSARSGWPSASISRSLLGNFEESILKGRFPPSGRIEGFTAEIGASGSYCPQHATLPVQVTYYDISEHSAPSPFLGVICLDPLGKKGYSVPKAGTIQVTLFNPNKTVVKMFLVTYNFEDMPVNHVTFLRHRIFLVPVGEEGERQGEGPEGEATDRKKILCYLIHLRFQSSKSGKIYLHNDIRLLFSRKSIEVDTGIPYELKSFTEVPRNPKYSPRLNSAPFQLDQSQSYRKHQWNRRTETEEQKEGGREGGG
ncbi:hypothetical protein JZ751_011896 [Albula glossodonta]|uniref:Atos homolog protein B n=1 Tax=Albula glossodonta TaxID=121402 RepID=A0A8T2PQY7_9TELE|nr:hypothetical protein JZ751_011896 [Albula glossodonta]